MLSNENTFVKPLSNFNLIFFYITCSESLIYFIIGEYWKSLFLLIIGLTNLLVFFDINEFDEKMRINQ